MKIILIFILSIAIYAQDSNFVEIQKLNSSDIKIPISNNSKNENSLIKMVPLRYWKLNMNGEQNAKVDYKFPIEIKNKKQSFIENNLFYVAVGSAIALGATAAYCKNQSDKNYQKYEQTHDSKYLTKSNNFDLYGGLAIGGLQLNFGYLLYRFLTD